MGSIKRTDFTKEHCEQILSIYRRIAGLEKLPFTVDHIYESQVRMLDIFGYAESFLGSDFNSKAKLHIEPLGVHRLRFRFQPNINALYPLPILRKVNEFEKEVDEYLKRNGLSK